MIRDARPDDFDTILALNLEAEALLSPLDRARLEWLDSLAERHRVVEADGQVVAFLLTFGPGSDYDSANYRWFADRYEQFIYVDRITVSAAARGRGLGPRLYDDLFARARAAGIARLTCEYNLVPLNAASQAFHDRYGFAEVGRQTSTDGKKELALCVRELAAPSEPS